MSEELTEPQKEINGLVAKAQKALEEYANYDQEKIDYIVAKASIAALDQHGALAKLAVEETKRGVLEDKATKNLSPSSLVTEWVSPLLTEASFTAEAIPNTASFPRWARSEPSATASSMRAKSTRRPS